ncbi:MAG: DegT/DnrJ/EryC1/StrS aminotransferase family protein [Betaproteobacteria bacterium]|nr:DegT/DnrJ/EryC1/StrS aminotransferase family protein [Betaproteobacteria bacterium]
MPEFKYPVYRPNLTGNEKRYVNECLDSSWISSKGAFVARFEKEFAAYVGAASATSCSNGTVSLHLALLALGIGEGDEIIVPTFTYVASVNAIRYVGATPVFVDSNLSDWQLDVELVKRALTPRTKAVMAVHLYGQACPMLELAELCKKHGLYLVEDCAEALGTRIGKSHVGIVGDIGSFSFFGNKTITTGEGGMLVSNRPELIARCAHLKSQAVSPERTYWHDAVGFNYRMTNICAAIGTAQLERINSIVAKKRALAFKYRDELAALSQVIFHDEQPGTTHSFWMVSIRVADETTRDALRQHLAKNGIETRPGFPPSHFFPMHSAFAAGQVFERGELLGATTMNLPSYPDLSSLDVEEICSHIRNFFGVH